MFYQLTSDSQKWLNWKGDAACQFLLILQQYCHVRHLDYDTNRTFELQLTLLKGFDDDNSIGSGFVCNHVLSTHIQSIRYQNCHAMHVLYSDSNIFSFLMVYLLNLRLYGRIWEATTAKPRSSVLFSLDFRTARSPFFDDLNLLLEVTGLNSSSKYIPSSALYVKSNILKSTLKVSWS